MSNNQNQGASIEAERADFKAWWAKRVPAGSDSDHAGVFAFEVWQAARRTPAAAVSAGELPPLPDAEEIEGVHGYLDVYYPDTVLTIQRDAFEAGKASAIAADRAQLSVPLTGSLADGIAMRDAEVADLRAQLAAAQHVGKHMFDALAAPASAQPELTVWYGPMPESNGKSNFTAVLMRKDAMWAGPHVTIERSEYPDRIRYEADRVRYLIGELTDEPDILAYDADKHSGYVPRATVTEPAAPMDRDAILESVVQAIADRAGDSDKISLYSAFDAIRAMKKNRQALPEPVAVRDASGVAPATAGLVGPDQEHVNRIVSDEDKAALLTIAKDLEWSVNGAFIVTKSGEQMHTLDALAFARMARAYQAGMVGQDAKDAALRWKFFSENAQSQIEGKTFAEWLAFDGVMTHGSREAAIDYVMATQQAQASAKGEQK